MGLGSALGLALALALGVAPGPHAGGAGAAPVRPERDGRGARSWESAAVALPPAPSTRWDSVLVGDARRHYLVSLPPSRRAPVPLVVAFHGLGQHASAFAELTGLVPATRAAGEALVVPESRGPAFNDGRLGRTGPADDAFALAVVDQLADRGLVDPARVTVTGFSNGAGMAMEVAGAHPGAVAAVVSVDGALIAAPSAPRPTGPVGAVLVHGTADQVQPWAGRPAHGVLRPAYISVPGTVQAWVRADGAGAATRSVVRGPASAALRRVDVTTWAPGPAGAGVTSYAVEGMGHRWPVVSAVPGARGCVAPAPISATGIIVRVAAGQRP